jgi:tetratricopeptide (TPR) repeat protein
MIRWSDDNYEQRRSQPNAVEIVFVSRLPSCATTSSSSNNDNDNDNHNTPAQKSEPHHHCLDDDVKDEVDIDDCAYSDATSVSSVTLASTFDEEEEDDDIVTLVENGMTNNNNNKRGGFFASLTLEEEEEEEETLMMALPPPARQPQHLLVSDTDVPLWFSPSSNHDANPSMMIVWNLNSSDHSLADVDNDVNNNIIKSKDHRPTITEAARIRQHLLQSSSPVVARIWIRRGDAYVAKHWYRQAQLAYQHAIDVLTDNDIEDGPALSQEAYAGLERVHQALGDRDRAEKYRVLANDDALRGAATAAAIATGGGSQRWCSLANDDALSDLFRRATTID